MISIETYLLIQLTFIITKNCFILQECFFRECTQRCSVCICFYLILHNKFTQIDVCKDVLTCLALCLHLECVAHSKTINSNCVCVSPVLSRVVFCLLPTCAVDNMGSDLQHGDEKAGDSTKDPWGPGKK